METDLETQMYVGQKAFIERNGKILVLRDPNYAIEGQVGLDFPGGRFRWGNSLEGELKREVEEETGLEIEMGEPFVTWTNFDHNSQTKKRMFVVAYKCKYTGGDIRLSDEHDKFEWVDEKSYKKWKEDSDYFKALEKYFKGT